MVYLRELMYSVSLWMDNGTAIAYVNKTPNVDRVHLLSQVAEGGRFRFVEINCGRKLIVRYRSGVPA